MFFNQSSHKTMNFKQNHSQRMLESTFFETKVWYA